MALEGNEQPI